MPHEPAKVQANIVSELKFYFARRGRDLLPLLKATGIDPAAGNDPLGADPLPLVQCVDLLERAAETLGDPCFGLKFGCEFRPGGTGLVGHLMINAPTVRDLVSVFAEYATVMTESPEIRYTEQDGIGMLSWTFERDLPGAHLQYSLAGASSFVMRVRIGAGKDWVPVRTDFAHREVPCASEVRAVFGERVRYNQSISCIIIDPTTLAKPLPKADPNLFAILKDAAQRSLQHRRGDASVVRAVREEIVGRLKNGSATLDSVSTALGVAPRSLQWRLEQAGMTFEKVLNQTRVEIAEHLLSDTERSLTEIAFDLGFSDPSTFTRAAKRWFNVSPREFRKRRKLGTF